MPVKLNPNEHKVLKVLAGVYGDFGFFGFAGISSRTSLNRRNVRLACRSLRRKGLADFCRGLWTEDGELAGSGYGATREGVELIEGPLP